MRIIKILYLILFLLSTANLPASAQQKKVFGMSISEKDEKTLLDLGLLELFRDRVSDQKTLKQWMSLVYENGYLLANYRLIEEDSLHYTVFLEVGDAFVWASLEQGNLPDQVLYKTGYKNSFFNQGIVNFRRVSRLFRKVIGYSENNGYPFASIQLEALEIEGGRVSARIDYNPGPFITFDSITLINKNKIKPGYLGALLNMKPGSTYDQRKVDAIPGLIGQIPYITLQEDPVLYFANEQCRISLALSDQKASAFDGIVGFLPNENEEGKLLITGQLYLHLQNLFRSGKNLELNWQKVNVQSQDLHVQYGHPRLFRSPIDLEFSFNLYKQDTTFLTRDLGINLFYSNHKKGKIGINYLREASRLLATEPMNTAGDPFYADYNLNYYGLAYRLNTLDHPFFPTTGWQLNIGVDAGNKHIIKNASIDEDFYEGLPEQGIQWKLLVRASKYFSLRPRNILHVKVSAGYMDGDQLFLNDLFRLGGLNTIRGFNEMFFYASRYAVGTLEYRYLFENESQLLVFLDGSLLGHNLEGASYSDNPIGTGAGISISTKAGLLNVIYGIGMSNDQSFNFKYSKIHIGYTGRF